MTNLLLLSTGAIVGIVIAAVVVLLVVILIGAVIGIYNSLVRLKNTVDEAWSTIDVQLKKRYDLIPNLVETVKGYATHESETLEKVIAARKLAMSAGSTEERMEAENMLTGTLKSLFALNLQERYPDLKANAHFTDLMNQLQRIEEEIASARRYYNGTVKEFNTKIELFPSNIIANLFGFKQRQFFEIAEEEQREPVAVKF